MNKSRFPDLAIRKQRMRILQLREQRLTSWAAGERDAVPRKFPSSGSQDVKQIQICYFLRSKHINNNSYYLKRRNDVKQYKTYLEIIQLLK